ncbi:tyrosine-protein phosphatase [Tetragenococcus halophilus]|uniref:tyrosine-protein phosphatase n=1 Tax=Tetragenococcus halophilus TaxID=51669 RepID=UPI00209B7F28|nr:tyrosine-protein phosphatase [Tetragenococcus halophilus]MCO8292041.1 tyrosine-protein phosphatase [Tetragenococcus halophilus]MCO8296421.1 tyrosine-protein phosphatase [Tetragenococcus halophilus]
MKNRYKVEQTRKNYFHFEIPMTNKEREVEVFLIENSQSKFLLKTKQENFDIELNELSHRPYFLIKTEEDQYITAERTLPIEGMNNFRDMGGYETDSGKTVQWGKLYRSDHIHNATDKGIAYLQTLGIHTIIDYRSNVETQKYPNKQISDQVTTYQMDPSAHAAELAAQFQSSKEEEDANLINEIIEQKEKGTLVDHSDVVLTQYHTFVTKKESQEAFSKMLQIVADPNAPAVVQHCRGGKDRTGFGSMLVLGTLGVKKEDLVEDYLLTAKNRIERNRIKMEGYKKLTSDPVVLNQLYSFIDTKPEFIEESIDTINNRYGSIENYVKKELKLTEQMVQQMKTMYLE